MINTIIETLAALNLVWVFGYTEARGHFAIFFMKIMPVIIAAGLMANVYARLMGWPV